LTLKYNGGLFCSLPQDSNPSFEEKYPPGTCVECYGPSTNMLLLGTVMDIPFPSVVFDEESDFCYTILFDNGSTASIPLSEMASIIPSLPVEIDITDSQDSLLPPFL
jgi:hypothetical protein